MFPEKLDKAKHYNYTSKEIFKDSSKLVSGFLIRDYSIDMHLQEFIELNIVMGGEGVHYIEDNRLNVSRGDVFVIPPGFSHGYVGKKGFDVFHVLLSNKFFEKHMTDFQSLPSFFVLFKAEPIARSNKLNHFHLSLNETDFKKTEEILIKIQELNPLKTPDAVITINSLATILIAYLCRIYSKSASFFEDSVKPQDSLFMNTLAMIHEKYHEKLSIDALAKSAMLSRSSFIKKFNDVCKTSPARYITQVRIESAKHMLSNTGFSVEEISHKTGFHDASHFTKAFISATDMTPGEYRRIFAQTKTHY